jgi:hypothetical protein
MSEKPQTSNQIQPKLVKFNYRNTRMGGFDDVIIISFKTKKVIRSKLHLSKSGRHGTRTYALLPAKYLLYIATRSNLGNTYISVKVVQLKKDGAVETLQQWDLYEGKKLKISLLQLPKNIAEILHNNRNELPLFYYIEDQDLISQ